MTTNRVATTTVQYQVNQSSVAQVQAANQAIAASYVDLQSAASTFSADVLALNPQFAAAINTGVVAPMQNASAATQNLIRDIGDLGRDIQSIPEPPLSAFGIDDGTDSGGTSGGGIRGLRGGFRATAGLLGAEAGGGAFRSAGQIVALTSVLGPLGIVAGGAALALRAVTTAQQEETDALKANLDVQRQVAHEIDGMTTQDIIAKRDAAQKALEIDREVAGQQLANSLVYKLSIINDPIKFGASIAGLDAQTNAWNDEIAKNNVAIAADQAQVKAFSDAINSNASAAADAAAAQSIFAKQKFNDDQLRQKVDQEDAAQRQTRIAELQREIAINREDAQIYAGNHDAVVLLGEEYLKLTRELEFTSEVTDTYADKLKKEADQKQAITNYFDALTAESDAIQKTMAAQQDLVTAASDHADKLAQIQQNEQDKEAADRQKAAQQAEDDQAKHLQKLADISNQAAADHEADVGNRDALANYKDAQKADQQTQKENDAYTLQEQQLQTHLAEQLQSEQAAEQKSQNQENTSYTKRYNQLLQALNDAQVAQSRADGLALAYQRQANQQQLNQQVQHQNDSILSQAVSNAIALNTEIRHQNDIRAAVYYGNASVVTAFAGLMTSLAQIATGAGLGIGQAVGNLFNNGGIGLPLGAPNATSVIQKIVNAQINNMIQEANR